MCRSRQSCARPIPPFRRSARPARGSRSAPASPWRRFWPIAISPSCIRPRALSAARPCAAWRVWAAICSRRRPMAISPPRLLALDATVSVTGGYSASETPLEEFLASRDRGTRGLVASVSFPRLANPDAFRFRKVSRVKPKGVAVLSIAALAAGRGRPHQRRAHRLQRDGADADARQGRRARAGRAKPRRGGHFRRARGLRRRHRAGRRCHRQRLVSPRDIAHSLEAPAAWTTRVKNP